MYFRCPDCLASTWMDRLEPPRRSEALSCAECEGSFEVRPILGDGAVLGDHYRRSLALSNEKQIDMPTAYSVVLGLLTLDQVRLLQGVVTPEPVASEPTAPERPRSDLHGALLLDLDPGFQKAVADGCLTIQEAIRRGNREAHAAGLARRHGLAMELAYRVSDNRVSLHAALKGRPAVAPAVARPTASATPIQRRVVFGVALLALLAFTWGKWSSTLKPLREHARAGLQRSPPAAAEPRVTAPAPRVAEHPNDSLLATELLEDAMGRLTRVTGPDPDTVLAAFCRHGGLVSSKQPIEVTRTKLSSSDARLGVFRDLDSLAADKAIRIRRDWKTRRWVTGDGVHPVTVRDAPSLPSAGLQASLAPSAAQP